MKTMKEIRDYLLENRVDEYGDLILSNLDLSDFEGNVYINNMKVKGNLFQNGQKVQGDLSQSRHAVKGNLYQYGHEAQGHLNQSGHKVHGNLYNEDNKYGGELYEEPSTKMLKEITVEELEELGYKLKKEE